MRHNLACSMIFKSISKTGSIESQIKFRFVCINIGSIERLTMQNPQIPNTAETRIVPKWLFLPCFSNKNRITSSCPDAVLVAPIFAKTIKQQTSCGGGRVLRSGRGQLRETRSTSTAPPAATNRSTFSISTPTQRSQHFSM